MSSKRSQMGIFLKAGRAKFLLSSLIPALIAAAVALYRGADAKWILFPVILLGVASLHLFINLVNEYFDFKRGVDPVSEEEKVHLLASGAISPRQVLFFMGITFALGFGTLILLSFQRGFLLFLLGVLGFAGGYSYTGPPLSYKYRGAGEIMILLFMGPLLGSGIYIALTGKLSFAAVAASLPPGLLITAVLTANNIRDIGKDRAAGIKTMPIRTGRGRASNIYLITLASVFIWITVMTALQYFHPSSLLSLIFIPAAAACSKNLKAQSSELYDIDLRTLKIYAGINSILALSFLLGALV